MIYVASPYSHPDFLIRKSRFLIVEQFVAHCLINLQTAVFSPIVYWHKIAVDYDIPSDAQTWLPFNTNMIRRSESMFVLKLEGWQESKGVKLEMNFAKMLNIPTVDFDANFNNLTELQAKFGIA